MPANITEIIGGMTALLVVIATIYTASRSTRNDGYSQLERVAAKMEKQIMELTSRVTALENEKDQLQNQIVELRIENAQLRASMKNNGGFKLK